MEKLDFFRRHRNVMKEAESNPGNVPVVSRLGPKEFMTAHMNEINDHTKKSKKKKRRVEKFTTTENKPHTIVDSFIYALIGAILMIILNSEVIVGIISKLVTGVRTQNDEMTNDNNIITHRLVTRTTMKGMLILGAVFVALFIVIDTFVIKNDVIKTISDN